MGTNFWRFGKRIYQLYDEPLLTQSFLQRLSRALLFWGATALLWSSFRSHAFREPIDWRAIMLLLLVPALWNSLVLAAIEYGVAEWRKRKLL
jgi:hypothetical protein